MIRGLVARLRGDVDARRLAAYRRGGIEVSRLLDDLESRPRAASESAQTATLSAWNAYVRQTIADRLVDGAYLSADTAAQARALYEGVGAWLVRARSAHASPEYRLDVHVPEALPRLLDERYSEHELSALRSAAQALEAHAEQLAGGEAADTVRQTMAAARAALAYTETLWSRKPDRELALAIGTELVEAIALLHVAGQLAAMPALSEATGEMPAADGTIPLPGERGFDPWSLADRETARRLRLHQSTNAELAKLWDADPAPVRTLALLSELERAESRGDAQRMPPGTTAIGALSRTCPWPTIYVALRPLAIGGANVPELHSFALTMGLEDGAFRRGLVVGPRIYVPKPREYKPRGGDDLLLDGLGLLGLAALIDL